MAPHLAERCERAVRPPQTVKESNVKLCKTGQYWAHAQYEEAAHELALKRLKSNERVKRGE